MAAAEAVDVLRVFVFRLIALVVFGLGFVFGFVVVFVVGFIFANIVIKDYVVHLLLVLPWDVNSQSEPQMSGTYFDDLIFRLEVPLAYSTRQCL